MRKKRSSSSDRQRTALLALMLTAGLASAHVGCTTACDTEDEKNPPQVFAGGTANGMIYESSPATSDVLPFPGGKQYFLVHHLGFTPTYPQISVGFAADGEGLAPCTGNTCVVRCV